MKFEILKNIRDFHNKHTLAIDKPALERSIDKLYNALFPICLNVTETQCDSTLEQVHKVLVINIQNLGVVENPTELVDYFFGELPKVQETLYEDAKAFYNNDPSVYSVEEVILSYPGFYALVIHRLANVLYKQGVPIIPRIWSEFAHTKAGIDINPGATIGERFFLDHGTGVVIGETAIIGNDVKIYQNVTLGALHVTKDMQSKKRHPTIEDNVIIYSGATILGGATNIGHGSTVGGNVWLTKSIDPFSVIHYVSQLKYKAIKNHAEPLSSRQKYN